MPSVPVATLTTVPRVDSDSLSDFFAGLRFVVNAFGHQHDSPTAEAAPRVIGDLELIYFRGGLGRVIISEETHECRRGDLMIIPPFAVHEIRTIREDPHDNFWVHFDVLPVYARDQLVSLLSEDRCYRLALDLDGPIARTFELFGAAMEARGDAGTKAVLEGYLRVLCVELARVKRRSSTELPSVPLDSEREILDRIVGYVEAHISDDITVERLVDVAGCSRSSLFALVRRVFDRPPMAVVRWMRLRHAERLLRTTTLSIKEISAAVGIASPFHLSRLVKGLYGVSPQHLRTSGHVFRTP
jgi:AraC-like DNA-binding protein